MSSMTATGSTIQPRVHDGAPRRSTLVALAGTTLVAYVALLAAGSDIGYDTPLAEIVDAYDQSKTAMQVASYVAMAFAALLLFLGAALCGAFRSRARSWLTDVAFVGFAGLAATIASWAVVDLALWKAVDAGDESTIRTMATISDAGFLPLMAAMIAIYVGAGLAALRTGSLPRWLAIASVVVGLMAPLGPLGFVGAMVLPLFLVGAAVTVRIDDAG